MKLISKIIATTSICVVISALLFNCFRKDTSGEETGKHNPVSSSIYMGRIFQDTGLNRENFQVNIFTPDDPVDWRSWEVCGNLFQYDATLFIKEDATFYFELRIENIGNNPYSAVCPEYQKIQLLLSDGLYVFPSEGNAFPILPGSRIFGEDEGVELAAKGNTIPILPFVDEKGTEPLSIKMFDEQGKQTGFISLIPKHDSKEEYKKRFREREDKLDDDIMDSYEEGKEKRIAKTGRQAAILQIYHPEFQLKNIDNWKTLYLCIYIEPYFEFLPFNFGVSMTKLNFCIPDFKEKITNPCNCPTHGYNCPAWHKGWSVLIRLAVRCGGVCWLSVF